VLYVCTLTLEYALEHYTLEFRSGEEPDHSERRYKEVTLPSRWSGETDVSHTRDVLVLSNNWGFSAYST
jgi:hypothetical protein